MSRVSFPITVTILATVFVCFTDVDAANTLSVLGHLNSCPYFMSYIVIGN